MTNTDYTINIFFKEYYLENIIIKGIETKVFHGYLTYTPDYCPNCGCINEKSSIIK